MRRVTRPRELTLSGPMRSVTDAPDLDRFTVVFLPVRMRLRKMSPMTKGYTKTIVAGFAALTKMLTGPSLS